jgi:NhaP-type Na+/H+ or K+/H+ antiporter
MTWLVSHLEGHVKFLPLIFALILVYGAAKAVDLSPLLIVLILGLMLNNPQLLRDLAQRLKLSQRPPQAGRMESSSVRPSAGASARASRRAAASRILGRLLGRLHSDHFDSELDKLKHLTAEATFLVRTFFFLLLGYETDLADLVDPIAWALAVLLVALIFGLRWPLMRWLSGEARAQPLVWAAPRGLITVLLFLSLPEAVVPGDFPPVVLILVVLLSSLVMALGLRRATPAPSLDDSPPPSSAAVVPVIDPALAAAPTTEHGPPDQGHEKQQRRERLDNQQPHDGA